MAATRKEKYVDLSARYFFEPIAVETLGVFNASPRVLFDDLGRRITSNSGEARETSFLYQRVSVLVQRYNAVLLHDSLPSIDRTYWWSYPNSYIHFLNFYPSRDHICRRLKSNDNNVTTVIVIKAMIKVTLSHFITLAGLLYKNTT